MRTVDFLLRSSAAAPEAMRQPTLLVFLARNCLAGVAIGWLLLAALFYFDVARLGELLAGSEDWFLTLILAGAGFGVTFGSLAMGTAIFLLPKN
ncbi:MAG: hypothetical protein ACJ8H8_17685 [Geminicoccaceae bacterium]